MTSPRRHVCGGSTPWATVLVLCALGAQACDSTRSGPPPSAPTPVFVPPAEAVMRVSGTVTDDAGAPLSGARVSSSLSALRRTVVADASGRYETIAYRDVWQSVSAEADGFEVNHQWATRGTASVSPEATLDFRLRRIVVLTAGESATLSIGPGDSLYGLDFEFVARTIRIRAPAAGVVELEALAVDSGAPLMVGLGHGIPDYPCCPARVARVLSAGEELPVHVIATGTVSAERQFRLASPFSPR